VIKLGGIIWVGGLIPLFHGKGETQGHARIATGGRAHVQSEEKNNRHMSRGFARGDEAECLPLQLTWSINRKEGASH
jgi:hypothetical protein